MSQKLELISDFEGVRTLEAAFQIARQTEMVKHQVTDKNFLASKDLEDVQSKKETGGSSWKREKERKRIHPKSKISPSDTDAVFIT